MAHSMGTNTNTHTNAGRAAGTRSRRSCRSSSTAPRYVCGGPAAPKAGPNPLYHRTNRWCRCLRALHTRRATASRRSTSRARRPTRSRTWTSPVRGAWRGGVGVQLNRFTNPRGHYPAGLVGHWRVRCGRPTLAQYAHAHAHTHMRAHARAHAGDEILQTFGFSTADTAYWHDVGALAALCAGLLGVTFLLLKYRVGRGGTW